MARGYENLILNSETSESMDQPSVQREHVVTIPSATEASSITSSIASAAAVGFQTVDPPCEGAQTAAASTSSAANTQGQSRAPRQRRRGSWSYSRLLLTFDFCNTSLQTLLFVAYLPVFRDAYAQAALRAHVFGFGIGQVLYSTFKCLRELRSNRLLPQVGNSQTNLGLKKILLKFWWISLNTFFQLWIGIGLGIVYIRWITRQTPHLNWHCTIFFAIACFGYVLAVTCNSMISVWCGVRIQKANMIWTLPVYKLYAQVFDLEVNQTINKEDNNMRDSIGGDPRVEALGVEVVDCCICLDPIEEGVGLKELRCTHHFHVKCIDQWLKINRSCPICKSEVGTFIRVFENEPTIEIVTV